MALRPLQPARQRSARPPLPGSCRGGERVVGKPRRHLDDCLALLLAQAGGRPHTPHLRLEGAPGVRACSSAPVAAGMRSSVGLLGCRSGRGMGCACAASCPLTSRCRRPVCTNEFWARGRRGWRGCTARRIAGLCLNHAGSNVRMVLAAGCSSETGRAPTKSRVVGSTPDGNMSLDLPDQRPA
jgi:hypothetical protein